MQIGALSIEHVIKIKQLREDSLIWVLKMVEIIILNIAGLSVKSLIKFSALPEIC